MQINYSYSSHLDILKDNPTYSYSYKYNVLSHLSITGDGWYASLHWQWQWQYCWKKLLLCSSSCKQICGTPHCYHIDMVSCAHRKCQTRAGVSGDVNKSFECVTITDSQFTNWVLVRMTPKSTSINWVTISLQQFDFYLRWCKLELPDQRIANCSLPSDFF